MFINSINDLEQEILESPDFIRSSEFGKTRKGHPEGKVGIHVVQIIEYIEHHYKNDSDYTSLRLLGLLHDIGKYQGNDEYHAITSEKIARKFIKDESVLKLILMHDRPYGFWKIQKKDGKIDEKSFIKLFLGLNWRLLVKFRYCDDCNRSQEASEWFEATCHELLGE